jgi:VanZ family protein
LSKYPKEFVIFNKLFLAVTALAYSKYILIILLFAYLQPCKAEVIFPSGQDTISAELKKQRLKGLIAGFSIGYSSSLAALHHAWYKHDNRSSFRFHDDLKDWNQLDKAGHFWTAFHQSRLGIDALRWAGVEERKSILYGGLLGVILQTPIEIFDGFSETYGASISDAAANTLGSAFVIGQELAWGQIRIMPKFSFRKTHYAPQRLEMFGNSYPEQMLKDYNGQSYWLSFDISSFLPALSHYPKWLNISAGYGAGGMIYGNPDDNQLHGFSSYRRFFISPDINLRNIPVKSKFLKKTFYVLSAFRIPMPAFEFNTRNQFIFHGLYF